MIGIKKGTEHLDMQPNTQLQRERRSPAFLEQTEDGKDGIPGEISYPFTLPLSDRNLRLLSFPDNLPIVKTLQHDVVLDDGGLQISSGKLIINSVSSNFNKNNLGSIDCHILSNVSEFWTRVKDKKLKDLSLGGERNFAWAGYSLVNAGFWKHCHDTWSYTNSDDGDYVFSPIAVENYRGEDEITWVNGWAVYGGNIELAREKNYFCLCPHPYVSYILRQIFAEHGYSVSGELLNDPDFKQLCFESYKSVNWAIPTTNGPLANPTVTIAPLNNITIKLNEHVPPTMTIGEFLVEMQKLFPISFIIDDRSKTCRVIFLSKLANAGYQDRTRDFNPSYNLSFEKNKLEVIYGFERSVDELSNNPFLEEFTYAGDVNSYSDLPVANASQQGKIYYVKYLNMYFACLNFAEIAGTGTFYGWFPGDNNGSYTVPNQTDAIVSNIQVPRHALLPIILNYYGAGNHLLGYFPNNRQLGNWYASGTSRDFEPWPARIFFYRGAQAFSAGGTKPLATNSIYNHNSAYPMVGSHPQVGNWSLSYKVGGGNYGLYDVFWSKWLPTLQKNETIKGRLHLKLHEYLQFAWDQIIMIQNTPYMVKKIDEILPYPGYVDIEAVRVR